MGVSAEDHGFDRSSTQPSITLLPIHPTTAWTKLALLKDGIGLLDPLSEFTFMLEFGIHGKPSLRLFFGIESGRSQKQRAAQEERILDEIPTGNLFDKHSIV